jgi:hypothetical protein
LSSIVYFVKPIFFFLFLYFFPSVPLYLPSFFLSICSHLALFNFFILFVFLLDMSSFSFHLALFSLLYLPFQLTLFPFSFNLSLLVSISAFILPFISSPPSCWFCSSLRALSFSHRTAVQCRAPLALSPCRWPLVSPNLDPF